LRLYREVSDELSGNQDGAGRTLPDVHGNCLPGGGWPSTFDDVAAGLTFSAGWLAHTG
jgi:hypothetical protein